MPHDSRIVAHAANGATYDETPGDAEAISKISLSNMTDSKKGRFTQTPIFSQAAVRPGLNMYMQKKLDALNQALSFSL